MSQEILDKLDVVIGLLQQLLVRREKHTQRQGQAVQWGNRSDTLIEMIKSPEWPEAVPGDLICTESETDKQERAEGIIEMMLPQNITKFLDFGCGEGHVPEKMAQRASLAVGYDILQQGGKTWEEQQGNFLLTTNLDKAKQLGPYDTILIYDVLDHCVGNTMQGILSEAKSILAPGGKIYLRTHPWTGRHGGHIYRQLNKAFAHFLLTDEELHTLGIDQGQEVARILHPIISYQDAYQKNGLKAEHHNVSMSIDPYFENPIIRNRLNFIYQEFIAKGWGLEWGFEFCDFILVLK
jgi:2-polyprenyl-3-methyl-5-hydroxy-6-metoxy-1,4-benzoquinol methylase